MFDTFIKCISVVYVIKLVLKHNLFIHNLKIKFKFLGLNIEVKIKEKKCSIQQRVALFLRLIIFNINLIQYP
ncbi:hypothetical protein CTM_19014 [Clostridium tetanomorphum DSM 665]|nr:hypothetical protein CTM_19014 [Clostridium tetanomorphum DSM 665]